MGAVPFFDGDGRLSCYTKSLTRPEARKMTDWTRILDYEVPEFSQEAINKIRVIFLDSSLSEVDGAYQLLGTAQATAGFFYPQNRDGLAGGVTIISSVPRAPTWS